MAFAAILASTAWLTRPPPPRAAISMAASGADDPTARLFAWVESRGGSADNVVASQTRFGLGLVAARPMKKGDAAVRLPPSCLLTVSPEAASPALATLQAEVPAEFWAARLGLALLSERAKGEASFVSEYVALLPAAFTAPLFWSPEAVSLLAYPTARARLLKTAKVRVGVRVLSYVVVPLNLIEAGLGFLPIEKFRLLTAVRPGLTFSGKTPSFGCKY